MPRTEHLIVIVLILAVLGLGYKKCAQTQENYRIETSGTGAYTAQPDTSTIDDMTDLYGEASKPPAPTEIANTPATSSVATPVSTDKPKPLAKPVEPAAEPVEGPPIVAKPIKTTKPERDPAPTAYSNTNSNPDLVAKGVAEPTGSRLYITSQNTKIRSEPSLKGKVLGKLPLYTEVYFMNEVSDKPEQLSIGKEVANERWVKVRTKKGTEGWVYGAYVNYFKEKRHGTW